MNEKNYPVNLLLVDDKTTNLEMIAAALDGQDVNVFCCNDSKLAWQHCVDEKIAIALIDVHMPDVNGYELLENIKENPFTCHILVILITGHSMEPEDIIKGLHLGAVDFLFKPIDLYILNAKVKSLLSLIRYQMQVEESKAEKENFLANMSHEVRTPVNAIIGLTHLLKNTNLDAEQNELMELMEYTSTTLLGIVNDILESSRIDAGKVSITPSQTDVRNLVKNVCEMLRPLAKQKHLELTYQVANNLPVNLLADGLRLNQILVNLINNAIKFTKSGSVNVSVNKLDEEKDRIHLSFTVKDTGIGIPPNAIENIFKRFEQVEERNPQKFGGTGLGLSIVQKLVELMSGTFEIESNVDMGTTFKFNIWFALPQNPVETPTFIKSKPLPKFENVKILLAEDNLINVRFVKAILEKWDIEVDVAQNGKEAFEKASVFVYDVLLMDLHMPVMDGFESIRKIRNEIEGSKSMVPIICFSASITAQEKNEVVKEGANDYLLKPFVIDDLHEKINALLLRHRYQNSMSQTIK